ncbi:ester cyclase [Bdellovibrio sp. BCCA]|uniref:ester cyclase n=1 Tax=Bdellovibrio sp. BCCA TaxID=3136281 RepID=UPI0030F271A3
MGKGFLLGLAVLATTSSLAFAKSTKQEDFEKLQKKVEEHLATFDDLDFNVFSNQKWDQLSKSHSKDILVHWPDGHTTKGIEKHIEDLKYMFTYAPDTRIKEHPIRIGQGEWTAVYGIMEGTFTKPMKTPDGKTIQPTNKSFKIPMATIGHWNNGTMDEEYLFWDNQTYMKQIGLGK